MNALKSLDGKSLVIGVLLSMLIVAFMLVSINGGAPHAWEYKNVFAHGSGINAELTQLGEEGWEVVGYTFSRYPEPGRGSDVSYYVLKRPKQKRLNWKFWK